MPSRATSSRRPASRKPFREIPTLCTRTARRHDPSAADRHDREVVRELVAAGLKGEVLVAEVMRLTGLPTSDVRTLIWVEMARPVLYGTTLEEIADECRVAVS
jgi:hypothetical protein